VTDRFSIKGDGPYFIHDKDTDQLVSMISFTTQAEAEAFVDLLTRNKKGLPKDER